MKEFGKKAAVIMLMALLLSGSINFSLLAEDISRMSREELCKSLMEEIKYTLFNESPDLTDEIYTGIMFLRLDAEKYYEEGDYESCLEVLEIVVRLINIDKSIELTFPEI